MHNPVEAARKFMQFENGSYSRLADHLNICTPRSDGSRWTKDAAYHLCRTHGIKSNRPGKNQPAAGCAQRAKTRQNIINATLDALSSQGRTIHDIAPVQLKNIVMLSRAPLYNVRNNWHELSNELNALAGLPKALRIIED
ncbi:hypothetical protein QVM41_23245 [Pseudomonas shirazica]|uniref:hypothetical protein n=1 Tax=Pseudomonas shirazica TaxID=1940636 RepID=UPI003524FC85